MSPAWAAAGARRALVCSAIAALALWSQAVPAQQPIRIVVPFAAGGTQDHMARLLARHISEGLKESVVVENKPGGASIIGTRHVVRSAPDGRTLLLAVSSLATNVSTHQLDFDPRRDLKPVIKLTTSENMLAVHSGLQVRTVAELARVAQQRPGGLNCAGVPGQISLACERFRLLLGGRVVTIPFQSLMPALNALSAGHVDIMFTPRSAAASLAAGEQVRILASASVASAAPPYQHLPLLKDSFPDMTILSSAGLYVAADTPPSLVAALNQELNRILKLPELRATWTELGYKIVGGPPEVLAKSLARDIEYYRRIVDEAGLTPDFAR